MNLAPVHIEQPHGDGVGRPVLVRHKRNRANGVMGVGGQFPNDVRAAVEELDSVLPPLSAPLSQTRTKAVSWSI